MRITLVKEYNYSKRPFSPTSNILALLVLFSAVF